MSIQNFVILRLASAKLPIMSSRAKSHVPNRFQRLISNLCHATMQPRFISTCLGYNLHCTAQSRRGPRHLLDASLIRWSSVADGGSLRASKHCYNWGVFCSRVAFWWTSCPRLRCIVCLLSLPMDLICFPFFPSNHFLFFQASFAPQTNFWKWNLLVVVGRKREIYFLSRRFKWLNLLQVYVSLGNFSLKGFIVTFSWLWICSW